MSEDFERTLCQISQVFVFKIPPRKTAEGHRAADWPKDPSWTGKLKVVARGSTLAIVLHDDKNQVFAICQVNDDSAVERTLDSGRYFVLRITNQQGRHAYIGIAFNERNDAFDFNVALNEFKNELQREQTASIMATSAPSQDFSLKSGEKIKIKIGEKKKQQDHGDEAPQSFPQNTASSFQMKSTSKPTPSNDMFNDPWGTDPWGTDPFAQQAPIAAVDPWGGEKGKTSKVDSVNLLDL